METIFASPLGAALWILVCVGFAGAVLMRKKQNRVFQFLAASLQARRHGLKPTMVHSRMTFREKSAALRFAALCLVFVAYFAKSWNAPQEVVVHLFIGSVALLVVILAIGHIALAVLHVPLGEVEDALDERDRDVELRSIRNAHYVLVGGIWITIALPIAGAPTLTIVNTAFAAFVLSELIRYGSLVAYYRRGTT
jgi:hypothetical protein